MMYQVDTNTKKCNNASQIGTQGLSDWQVRIYVCEQSLLGQNGRFGEVFIKMVSFIGIDKNIFVV